MKSFTLLLMFFVLSFVASTQLFGQKVYEQLKSKLPQEIVDQPYQYVDRASMPTSPSYEVITPNYFTKQVNIDSNGNNIVGDAANEPSIAIDPTNPDRVVIGWRQFDNVNNNFRQAGYGYSLNGGYNWVFPGVIEPGVFRSDPVLDFDNFGNFYYNSLSAGFTCEVFAIRDGGVVWGPPVPAQGGDKQWMRIDKTGGPSSGFNYSYWNNSFSTCTGSFTRSTDDANSFENCVEIIGDPFWGTLAVDAQANLYLTGTSASGIVIIKSTTAKDATNPVTFDFQTVVDLDGELSVAQPINPQGLVGQAWVDVDVSVGPGRDNVYVLASVERDSNNDPADVMFARSINEGASFEAPVRINTDAGANAYQWFGTMSVAPNGRIDVIWLDTRDAPAGTFDSVLYYTFSEDQGNSWEPEIAISQPFDPTIGYPNQNKMGDYFDMKSDNDYAHIAWCGTFTGGQDVFYTRVSPQGVLGVSDLTINPRLTIYPNPLTSSTTIQFYNASEENAQLHIYDVQGRQIIEFDINGSVGMQKINWRGYDVDGHKVASGVYFVEVQLGGQKVTSKLIVK